jgi:hypothetical protein
LPIGKPRNWVRLARIFAVEAWTCVAGHPRRGLGAPAEARRRGNWLCFSEAPLRRQFIIAPFPASTYRLRQPRANWLCLAQRALAARLGRTPWTPVRQIGFVCTDAARGTRRRALSNLIPDTPNLRLLRQLASFRAAGSRPGLKSAVTRLPAGSPGIGFVCVGKDLMDAGPANWLCLYRRHSEDSSPGFVQLNT